MKIQLSVTIIYTLGGNWCQKGDFTVDPLLAATRWGMDNLAAREMQLLVRVKVNALLRIGEFSSKLWWLVKVALIAITDPATNATWNYTVVVPICYFHII